MWASSQRPTTITLVGSTGVIKTYKLGPSTGQDETWAIDSAACTTPRLVKLSPGGSQPVEVGAPPVGNSWSWLWWILIIIVVLFIFSLIYNGVTTGGSGCVRPVPPVGTT